eukprot:150665-Rhodomonas_salina.3
MTALYTMRLRSCSICGEDDEGEPERGRERRERGEMRKRGERRKEKEERTRQMRDPEKRQNKVRAQHKTPSESTTQDSERVHLHHTPRVKGTPLRETPSTAHNTQREFNRRKLRESQLRAQEQPTFRSLFALLQHRRIPSCFIGNIAPLLPTPSAALAPSLLGSLAHSLYLSSNPSDHSYPFFSLSPFNLQQMISPPSLSTVLSLSLCLSVSLSLCLSVPLSSLSRCLSSIPFSPSFLLPLLTLGRRRTGSWS